MSGSGKSYWSKKLEAYGFKRYSCDDLIEERLKEQLKKRKCSGIQDVARWMGQPYEPQYQKNSNMYLDCEKEALNEILFAIERNPINGKNIVIDTTGSVIYLGSKIVDKLSQYTNVVYFQVPEVVKEEMYKLYIEDPKPVVWGKSFSKKQGEENIDALKRCYPNLLMFRAKQYEKLVDIILDYFLLRDNNFDVEDFIKLLKR